MDPTFLPHIDNLRREPRNVCARRRLVALGKSDTTTSASSVAFLSYISGAPIATLSDWGADSGVKQVGTTATKMRASRFQTPPARERK